ncbi:AraC family transcriptional regulator [Paenibacillus sedimenti]|uniref:AraC family transcriptional regulator n=1 Tax=Paenibacillus sedimenti TaxID=2770274 RepID=A0A926KWQ6_9BACL|nr:AraC family transcriptional regulator [Paenibacillus sedimenti]MBD0384693.1 AraC family transcriptional regulator [Paenibacillus sedimenti]
MVAKTLELEYRYQINQVVNYIEDHLTNPLTLEEVAGVSAFSPFHFHRVFKAVIGENLHGFIRRIRIEKAIKLLLFHPDQSITNIALECGLQTPAHFCRVFREHTGLSASEFRDRFHLQTIAERFRSRLTSEKSAELAHNLAELPIEIRNMAPMNAIYARYRGTINDGRINPDIKGLFEQVVSWVDASEALTKDSLAVGLVLDDPFITPNGRHRYDACMTTEHPVTPTRDLGVRTIPGGKYAIVKVTDRPDMVYDLLHLVSIDWLPRSPYIWDVSRPALEIYFHNSHSHTEGKLTMEFGIPVKLERSGY